MANCRSLRSLGRERREAQVRVRLVDAFVGTEFFPGETRMGDFDLQVRGMRLANHAPDGAIVKGNALVGFHVGKGLGQRAGNPRGLDDFSVGGAARWAAGFFFVGENQQIAGAENQGLFDVRNFREARLREDLLTPEQFHYRAVFDEGGLFGLAPAIALPCAADQEFAEAAAAVGNANDIAMTRRTGKVAFKL